MHWRDITHDSGGAGKYMQGLKYRKYPRPAAVMAENQPWVVEC